MSQPEWATVLPAPPAARASVDVSAETLERILDAAGRVFSRSGVTDVRMPRVAAEAGVSKPTLYRYVGGKAALLRLYLLREARREFTEALQTHWRDDLDAEGVTDLVVDLFLRARGNPVLARVIEEGVPGAPLALVAGGAGTALVDIGAWIFERAGVPDPRFAAELNLRIFVSLLVAPPFTSTEDVETLRRFVILPAASTSPA